MSKFENSYLFSIWRDWQYKINKKTATVEKTNTERNLITHRWHRKVTEARKRLYQEIQHSTEQNKVMEVRKENEKTNVQETNLGFVGFFKKVQWKMYT